MPVSTSTLPHRLRAALLASLVLYGLALGEARAVSLHAVASDSSPAQAQDSPHAGDAATPVVVRWGGRALDTVSGTDAVTVILRLIGKYSARDSMRLQEVRQYYRAFEQRHAPLSFDQAWHDTLHLGYRPLPLDGGDVRAAIEASIADMNFKETKLGELVIKLPHPMRFADLPQHERIVAVVAQSSLRGPQPELVKQLFKRRYAVVGRKSPGDTHFARLSTRLSDDGPLRVVYRTLPSEVSSRVEMDRVEYVIYR